MATTGSRSKPTVRAAVVHRPGATPTDLLDATLDAAAVATLLRRRTASRRARKRDLRIAIKPDLDVFEPHAPTGTDPALVEHLIAWLRRAGYPNVAVCDGRNTPDGWLYNRDALCVPDLVGYRFEAPAGEPYAVVWSGDDAVVVPTSRHDRSGALCVNAAWVGADVRISFAKAKTDERWGHALTVANLLGLIAPDAAAQRWSAEDRALHLLRRVPPHLALIDAVDGSHGSAGSRVPKPLETDTVIAATDALVADWLGALKMGADPHVSPLNDRALSELGLPPAWTLDGEATPWRGWRNPTPTLLSAVRGRARWPELDALARAVLQPVDRERFPHRDVVVDQISATVLARLDRVTDPRLRDMVSDLLARLLDAVAGARHAFVCNVTKGEVMQAESPLTLDVDRLRPADFDATQRIVEAQLRVLNGTPEDARGFRFRTVGGHVHFAASRVLPVSFDDFVERVDISAGIRYMNDYVGGSWTVVRTDDRSRPVRQAERNVYLPQPNWISAFGGEPIDVEKLERIDYDADHHTIWWRTVRSPNRSAESDDGLVTFTRTPADQVDVRVFARQRFRLPAAVAMVGVERWPGIHGELVADAYARFFDGTLANLRAAYEGRPCRIGRPMFAPTGEASDLRALLSGAFSVLARVLGWEPTSGEATSRREGGRVAPLFVDDLGFAHFPGATVPAVVSAGTGAPAAADDVLTPTLFLAELGRAIGRDLAAMGLPELGALAASGARGGEGGGGVPASFGAFVEQRDE